MKNILTRPIAAAGASVLAAVLLTGCGATSAPVASGSPASASSTASATASAKTAVPASGAADSGPVASSPNSIFKGSATLESFRISAKRSVDAQGKSVLSVTAQPTKASWTFNNSPLPASFYADRITLDDVKVEDANGHPLQRTPNKDIAFAVPSGSDTDTIKVGLTFKDEAKTTVPGYVPSDASAPATAEENFEIKDVLIKLTPDTK